MGQMFLFNSGRPRRNSAAMGSKKHPASDEQGGCCGAWAPGMRSGFLNCRGRGFGVRLAYAIGTHQTHCGTVGLCCWFPFPGDLSRHIEPMVMATQQLMSSGSIVVPSLGSLPRFGTSQGGGLMRFPPRAKVAWRQSTEDAGAPKTSP